MKDVAETLELANFNNKDPRMQGSKTRFNLKSIFYHLAVTKGTISGSTYFKKVELWAKGNLSLPTIIMMLSSNAKTLRCTSKWDPLLWIMVSRSSRSAATSQGSRRWRKQPRKWRPCSFRQWLTNWGHHWTPLYLLSESWFKLKTYHWQEGEESIWASSWTLLCT